MSALPDIEIIKKIIDKSNEKMLVANNNFDSGFYDDSVSRAYYAVFHFISAILLTKGQTYSTHSQTLGNFNKEFIKTGIFPLDFSKKIEKLFNARQIGDYDSDVKIDKNSAFENLKWAEEINSSCIDYLSKLYNVEKGFWEED